MNHKPPLHARYADLLTNQHDPALGDLVHDLDALYTANPVPARLTQSPSALTPVAQLPVQFIQPLADLAPEPTQETHFAESGTVSSHPRPVRRWSRFNSLAAVLCTLLLVGTLAGTFYALRQARSAPAAFATPTTGSAATAPAKPGSTATGAPTQAVHSAPQACPASVATPTYWQPIVSPYAYGGSWQVALVECASLTGTSALQALVTVRRADTSQTLDVFVFTDILNAHPAKIFQLLGLLKGDAKISGYRTVMTAQVDTLSALNAGKAISAMTVDLFREFKWSASTGTLTQTVFPGMFPDLTRYQAEADQASIEQGHQAWKGSATQVAVALVVSLLDWPLKATPTVISGGGAHDVSAVVQVKNTTLVSESVNVTLSRLEGNTRDGIWEVIAVGHTGLSITSPASLTQITSPLRVTGTGPAFEGVIGKVKVLDHLYNSNGQQSVTGTNGMGQTSFSASVTYQSSFPPAVQEGMLILLVPSNANGSIAAAVMEKVLIKGINGLA